MRVLIGGLMVALAGCGALPNDDICTATVPLEATEAIGGGAKPPKVIAEECVHRWGYRLAGASDEANTVADAVVEACREPMARYAAEMADQTLALVPANERNRLLGDARRLSVESARTNLKEKALFHVVQARAGHCKVPT